MCSEVCVYVYHAVLGNVLLVRKEGLECVKYSVEVLR